MPVYQVRIEPLDPLLFGDNRSARAGFDHLQQDQDPSPLTVHGAIGRYLESRSKAWPAELVGEKQPDILNPQGRRIAELLGFCTYGAGGGLLFPRPRHLRCTQRNGEPRPFDLLAPRKRGGAETSAPWPKLLFPGEDEPLEDEDEGDLVLREGALGDVLCGGVPAAAEPATAAFRAEPRPGIAVDNEAGTVLEGQLFTRPYRRFRPASYETGARGAPAGFAAWFETLAPVKLDLSDGIGFLGGDRRRARFDFARGEEPLGELRERVAETAGENASRGYLLYLLTPALQAGAPVEAVGSPPVAAALGKSLYASGWDVERNRPRQIRALVPAGSVWFFDWPSDAPAGPARAELVRRLWLHPLHREGAAAGFGRCLTGIWR
jgi:CRISPR type III-B/RAMP module-associated protein Cmr3